MDLTAKGAKQIATYVAGIHAIADIAIGKPGILTIEVSQAEELTKAVLDVMQQYKMKPNPKAVAWANLLGCAAIIYTPKALALSALAKTRRKQVVKETHVEHQTPSTSQPPMRFS